MDNCTIHGAVYGSPGAALKIARVTMRIFRPWLQIAVLLLCSERAIAATSWTFSDASISVQGKGSGVGGALKEKYIY